MSNVRKVEYYRLWEDHTWDTEFIDIPASTPDGQIEEAIRQAAAKIDWRDEVPVAVGLYCANDEEDYSVYGAGEEDESPDSSE